MAVIKKTEEIINVFDTKDWYGVRVGLGHAELLFKFVIEHRLQVVVRPGSLGTCLFYVKDFEKGKYMDRLVETWEKHDGAPAGIASFLLTGRGE